MKNAVNESWSSDAHDIYSVAENAVEGQAVVPHCDHKTTQTVHAMRIAHTTHNMQTAHITHTTHTTFLHWSVCM